MLAGPPRLHDGPTPAMTPKARALAVLAAAGLPVPPGFVLVDADARADDALASLAADGPVAIRGAAPTEDAIDHSGAGLSTSILGVRTMTEATAALASIPQAQRIVQRQVEGRALLAAALTDHGIEIEVHDFDRGDADVLSGHRTPRFAGRLTRWDDPVATRVETVVQGCVRAAAAAGLSTRHGWDLELVIDRDDGVWVVQLRPLVADLHPGWASFAAAVAEAQGRPEPDFGRHRLTLDAEHNPAPLSVAHTWLMERLEAERGAAAGSPRVLAGWLYVATLPRHLGGSGSDRATPLCSPLSPTEALHTLTRRLIPEARDRLASIERRIARDPSATTLATELASAWSAFLAMIDAYVGILVPARRAARRDADLDPGLYGDDPLTLRERARFADVLPAIWDLDSPTLAELGIAWVPSTEPPTIPNDPERSATLLAEWDDHLFALGLAPLRVVYRWVGRVSGLGDDVFFVRGDELATVIERGASELDLQTRRARQRRAATLHAPLVIDEGHPVAAGRGARLRGIPIGPSITGVATIRRDLARLLEAPPADDAVVLMPALTAPAAVALQRAGVRAVCSEHGGPLSHAALMARELGLSALIGCRGCTEIPDGTRVRLDTAAGRLVPLPPRANAGG